MLTPTLKVVRNVTRPTLTAYLPDPAIATGSAVIIAPGGAFHFLSIDMEGTDVATWLSARGVAAFVLKYRLVPTTENFAAEVSARLGSPEAREALVAEMHASVLADGQQAVKLVRQRAAEFGLAPNRIGLMGFSAGGVLTSVTAQYYEADCRPDIAAVIYGASGAASALPADAPPLFLLCASDDEMAVGSSLSLYSAWHAAGHSAEMHIYSAGGHGFGMTQRGLPSDAWIERFADWLRVQGWMK